jgi:hypothetical protein
MFVNQLVKIYKAMGRMTGEISSFFLKELRLYYIISDNDNKYNRY